ncbi:MAG: CHASE2 domain-containing protein, partial [Terriglobales bacterium]
MMTKTRHDLFERIKYKILGDRAQPPKSIISCIVDGFPLLAGLAVIGLIMSWLGLLKTESQGLDLALNVHTLSPTVTTVIGITDADYKNYFGSRTPLDPSAMANLIRVVDTGQPKVIVVDVDTGVSDYLRLHCVMNDKKEVTAMTLDPAGPGAKAQTIKLPYPVHVVWARGASDDAATDLAWYGEWRSLGAQALGQVEKNITSHLHEDEPVDLELQPVLGEEKPQVQWGFAGLPQDHDGSVR